MKYLILILILLTSCIPTDFIEYEHCAYCEGALVIEANTLRSPAHNKAVHTWCFRIFRLELEVNKIKCTLKGGEGEV